MKTIETWLQQQWHDHRIVVLAAVTVLGLILLGLILLGVVARAAANDRALGGIYG